MPLLLSGRRLAWEGALAGRRSSPGELLSNGSVTLSLWLPEGDLGKPYPEVSPYPWLVRPHSLHHGAVVGLVHRGHLACLHLCRGSIALEGLSSDRCMIPCPRPARRQKWPTLGRGGASAGVEVASLHSIHWRRHTPRSV